MTEALILTLTLDLIFAVGWTVVAALLPEERGAALCGSAYGILEACAVYSAATSAQLMGEPGLWSFALGTASCVAGDLGGDAFVNRGARHAKLWLGVAVVAIGMQWLLAARPEWQPYQRVFYDACVALLLCLPVLLFARPLYGEFGRLGTLALAPTATFAVFVIFLTLRLALHAGATAGHGPAHGSQAVSLVPVMASSSIFQLTWFALVLGRQVGKARRLALYDALTGLWLRPAFERELQSAKATARRYGHALSVAFIDIDRFKKVNDRGGHYAGDLVLRAVAQFLLKSVRDTDRVGRWGGEEFVLLLPNTDAHGARTFLERLQSSLRQHGISVPNGCAALSVSIGHATAVPGEDGIEALISRADAAMYAAKSRGGDCTVDAAALESDPAAT